MPFDVSLENKPNFLQIELIELQLDNFLKSKYRNLSLLEF